MRRTLGLVAVVFGAFLLVAAPMVKWYLAPRAAKVPLDQYSVSTSVSDGRSVMLDKGTLTIREGLTLTNRQVVQGTGAGDARTAVWESLTRLDDPAGRMMSATEEKVALDRVSATAVACCDEQLDGVPVRHEGLTFKFPFDTARHDYPFFDQDTRRAWPMVFQGEERAQGLDLLHFTQTIPATDVETLEVPKSLLGLPGEGSTTARRSYQNVTDVLVEPVTGIIVRGSQHQVQTLREAAGGARVTVADIAATYTEETQRSYADTARGVVLQLNLVRWILPLAGLVLGLALLVAGLVLAGAVRRPSRGRSAASTTPQSPANLLG